jgi:hypothetical protein
MNRINGHANKDINLVLKALEAGKKCVNFKLVYVREACIMDLDRIFKFGDSWMNTVLTWQQTYGFLTFDFKLKLSFSEKIMLTAFINNSTSGSLSQCREDHTCLIYVFRDVLLTPESSEKGFLYKHNAVFDWRWKHASITWVIKVLSN